MNDKLIGTLLIVAFIIWLVVLVFFPLPTLAVTVVFLVWVIYKMLDGIARMFQR